MELKKWAKQIVQENLKRVSKVIEINNYLLKIVDKAY